MKANTKIKVKGLKNRSELLSTGSFAALEGIRRSAIPQLEFGFVSEARKQGLRLASPYRLRAGDIVLFGKRICPVIRVNDCAAVLSVNRPSREFTTRFGKPVFLKPKPLLVRIAANSSIPILKRQNKGGIL